MACERALIGAALCGLDPLPPLTPDEFYGDAHRTIWAACLWVESQDGRPSLVTVAQHLDFLGHLEDVGGAAHLAQCVAEGCALPNLTGVARVVRELGVQREKIRLGTELVGNQHLSASEIEGKLAALPGPIAQGIWDPVHTWSQIFKRWGEDALRTGWSHLDTLTGGLWPGELIAVGGRTSHGKTAFSTASALRMARHGISVDIITLEDPVEAITRRLVSQITGISYRRLRTGDCHEGERQLAVRAVAMLKELETLHVTGIDRHGQSTEDGVLGLLAQAKGRVIILDHLQRVQTKDHSRAYALERVLGRVHGLVQRTGQVAWVNCQLNRDVEARQEKRPTLADLRDTGAVEILARQVWLLSWPRKWDANRPPRDYLLEVAKAGESGTGDIPLSWDASTGRFWTPDEGPPWDLTTTADWTVEKD